ncbi:MAG: hypothetical protein Q4G22_06055 [Paracoccus sp. (in: a-proteobacteria)]|uniref:hypothetical protein n=1 Tax=Paracoccus sp. TaxID=267 RepID=UPI0026E0BA02|nr:hypothetical protein [Paracoccus sp. (in: a-proteobacteria)]MDO5631385.1 hypothetical protein [Paracoccus sp. (in: a-proteobacteria)]
MNRIFRRRVLYIPGYDPIPPRRYRELYRREGADQARISGYTLVQANRGDDTGFGWAADSRIKGAQTHTEFEVLVWGDIVQGSMGRSIPATYLQLAQTVWAYVGSGALWRLMRLRRGPVIAALYPIAVLLAQLVVALLLAALAAWAVAHLSGWLAAPVAALVFAAVLMLWRRLDGRIFAYYLMHDYALTARTGGAYPPALETRIAAFTDRIAQVLAQDWDEVLIVGHSSGACIAVSAVADLLRRGTSPQRLSLMTLGHVVPMLTALPRADRLRADLTMLAGQDGIFWLDVTAPGDACCFGLCDPVAVNGLTPPGGQRGPLVLSAAFTQTLSPERQRAMRWRWFRRHFQYLCAFDLPRDYDYFAITAGPQSLRQRFGARGHSPGRITRPALAMQP